MKSAIRLLFIALAIGLCAMGVWSTVMPSSGPTDDGGWYYHDDTSTLFGTIVVNCTHVNSKGRIWSAH